MDVGSADSHTRPTSRWTSALVIPPIRNSATSAGSADPAHSRARCAAVMPTSRSFRMCPHTQSLASGLASASASSFSASNTSHAAVAHHLAEHVMLGLGPRHPQHVVEQQFLGVGRGQPGVFQARPVHHDLAQPADFGMHPERHPDHLVSSWPGAVCRRPTVPVPSPGPAACRSCLSGHADVVTLPRVNQVNPAISFGLPGAQIGSVNSPTRPVPVIRLLDIVRSWTVRKRRRVSRLRRRTAPQRDDARGDDHRWLTLRARRGVAGRLALRKSALSL